MNAEANPRYCYYYNHLSNWEDLPLKAIDQEPEFDKLMYFIESTICHKLYYFYFIKHIHIYLYKVI